MEDISWSNFHAKVLELNNAAQVISQNTAGSFAEVAEGIGSLNSIQPLIPRTTSTKTKEAQRSIIESSNSLQCMLRAPADLLEHLTIQIELFSCLKWLCNLQVLACIPLDHISTFRDVADLANVPQSQLIRVIRLTASFGFLKESKPGHVGHSPLSARFVLEPSFHDALVFLTETATPAALEMTRATKMYGETQRSDQSAYRLAFPSSPDFAVACEQQKRLRRRYDALSRVITDNYVTDLPNVYDWIKIGAGKVVEICARSTTAMVLAETNPTMHLVIQTNDSKVYDDMNSSSFQSLSQEPTGKSPGPSRQSVLAYQTGLTAGKTHISSQYRDHGTPQTVRGASVYLYQIPPPSVTRPLNKLLAELNAELCSHFPVLRASRPSILLLIVPLSPNPEAFGSGASAKSCAHEMLLQQLTNHQVLELENVLEIIDGVEDSSGRLAVAKRSIDGPGSAAVLEIMFEERPSRNLWT